MTRIALLSGPRNISTTMMRAFENRPDTIVFDEPFYASYLEYSGAQHPMREDILASQPRSWHGVIDQLSRPLPEGARYAFEKHIAFHLTENIPVEFFNARRIIILIRNPEEMIASYHEKYENVSPIVDSFQIQQDVYRAAIAAHNEPIIVDAKDILSTPEAMLMKICEKVEIPFTQSMMQWPEGQRDSDGVWASHWYEQVVSSTGFRAYVSKTTTLSSSLKQMADHCMPAYNWLHQKRLTL